MSRTSLMIVAVSVVVSITLVSVGFLMGSSMNGPKAVEQQKALQQLQNNEELNSTPVGYNRYGCAYYIVKGSGGAISENFVPVLTPTGHLCDGPLQ